ncbi:MAG: MBL fold metallo-hydrolase [Pseudomonadota bacterium]
MRDQSLASDEDFLASDNDAAPVGLAYPFADTPAPGQWREVADGVWWLRMPLPFSLDHINLYLIADGDGVAIVDTGLATRQAKALWRAVLTDFIGARPVTRIIVTHCHPDHVGLAGWLSEETGAPLAITRTEYLLARMLSLDVRETPPDEVLAFYRRAGFSDAQIALQKSRGWGNYARGVHPLPLSIERIADGDCLPIGGRDWRVVVGRGHAPEHACLHCPELGLLISGDQVLPRISSNVSVYPTEPEGNPLNDWLLSLSRLKKLPAELLVLPAHNEPFHGLHARLDGLIHGHCAKLARLLRALDRPRPATATLNTLFGRGFDDAMLLTMATGESLAHLRYLEKAGFVARGEKAGVDLYARLGDGAVARADLIAHVAAQQEERNR